MKELYYAGISLEKDLQMCKFFDELAKNDDVIILKHGRDCLIHECKYKNNYSTDREDTGRIHTGFESHYITFYYKGRIYNLEPSSHYPFTDENDPGEFNVVPYELIDGWSKKQIGYCTAFESIKDLSKFDPLRKGDVVYEHTIPFYVNKQDFLNIYYKKAGNREKEVYEAPHICYLVEDTKEHKVVRCAKLDRDEYGVRKYFDIDITRGEII